MANANGFLTELRADARALCKRTWWVFLIGGIAAVVFGLLAFARPVEAWFIVATFFAASILVDGAVHVVGSLGNRANDGWWIMLLMGALGVLVGGYALLHPLVSMAAFVYLVAFQAVLFGVFLLMLGYKVRAATEREWLLYLAGAISLLFGILAFAQPGLGGLSVIWTIATWAVVMGVLRIVFAFKAKALPEKIQTRMAA
ncbi:MAG: HdeD family acid-resistance protein [Steroidobacteraceae bacterium]